MDNLKFSIFLLLCFSIGFSADSTQSINQAYNTQISGITQFSLNAPVTGTFTANSNEAGAVRPGQQIQLSAVLSNLGMQPVAPLQCGMYGKANLGLGNVPALSSNIKSNFIFFSASDYDDFNNKRSTCYANHTAFGGSNKIHCIAEGLDCSPTLNSLCRELDLPNSIKSTLNQFDNNFMQGSYYYLAYTNNVIEPYSDKKSFLYPVCRGNLIFSSGSQLGSPIQLLGTNPSGSINSALPSTCFSNYQSSTCSVQTQLNYNCMPVLADNYITRSDPYSYLLYPPFSNTVNANLQVPICHGDEAFTMTGPATLTLSPGQTATVNMVVTNTGLVPIAIRQDSISMTNGFTAVLPNNFDVIDAGSSVTVPVQITAPATQQTTTALTLNPSQCLSVVPCNGASNSASWTFTVNPSCNIQASIDPQNVCMGRNNYIGTVNVRNNGANAINLAEFRALFGTTNIVNSWNGQNPINPATTVPYSVGFNTISFSSPASLNLQATLEEASNPTCTASITVPLNIVECEGLDVLPVNLQFVPSNPDQGKNVTGKFIVRNIGVIDATDVEVNYTLSSGSQSISRRFVLPTLNASQSLPFDVDGNVTCTGQAILRVWAYADEDTNHNNDYASITVNCNQERNCRLNPSSLSLYPNTHGISSLYCPLQTGEEPSDPNRLCNNDGNIAPSDWANGFMAEFISQLGKHTGVKASANSGAHDSQEFEITIRDSDYTFRCNLNVLTPEIDCTYFI